jgi:pSer/pThr/pTyr-binding forkhead associated (FHA) protein
LAGEVTLGRNEENALVIGDRFTSGRHARLCEREGAYWVEDLGSRNGTLLNGRRIRGAERLWPGDRLTVGSCTFRFMR